MSTEQKNPSTGPRTEEGKAISSLNAVKHGLTAMTVLLPGEDPAVYQALYDGMLKDFSPINTTGTALVQELVDLEWRLRRASAFEARVLASDTPDLKSLNSMSLIAARLKRQFTATLKEFGELDLEMTTRRNGLREAAVMFHRADQLLGRPSTVAERGFDFTLEYLDNDIAYDQALADATELVKNHENGLDEDSDDDLDLAA